MSLHGDSSGNGGTGHGGGYASASHAAAAVVAARAVVTGTSVRPAQRGLGAARPRIHARHASSHGPQTSVPGQALVPGPPLHGSTPLDLIQNADAPAIFADGRAAYLNRPLPVLPPRAELSTMPPRPSTSGGTAPSRTDFDLSDRRISRDDMFLQQATRPTMGDKRMSRDDMFVGARQPAAWRPAALSHVGEALSPPEFSPGAPSPATIAIGSVPRRRETLESLGSAEIPIGMAIGSPTHIRAASSFSTAWVPQAPAPAPTRPPEPILWPEPPVSQDPPARPEPPQPSAEPAGLKRSKTGRRKLFGLFGSRKNSSDASRAPRIVNAPNEPLGSAPVSATAPASSLARSQTSAGAGASRPPPFSRTDTDPFRQNPVDSPRSMPLRNNTLQPNWRRQQQETQVSGPLAVNGGPSGPFTASSKGPLLDVEIPSIKMERYSVMFGSLLEARRSSSLLNRRQAALERLHSISDKVLKEEEAKEKGKQPRRATSPQPTTESPDLSSPAFSLFPSTPNPRPEHLPAPPMSPRLRSNTSPAMLPSPSQSAFSHDALPRNTKDVTDGQSGSPAVTVTLRRSPSTTGKNIHFEPNQSNLILDSPTSMYESKGGDAAQPMSLSLKPTLVEPQWQMITPPTSAAASSTSSASSSHVARKRSPTSTSSVQTHGANPPVEIDESDSALKAAVEISIARQISVSRQQRQLLAPLHASPGGGMRQGAAAGKPTSPRSVASGSTASSPLMLHESKASTPTLVHPHHPSSSQFSTHRKSSRVVLEAA